ncbi:uncharacterized protein WCC33_017967 [Rhinophrynus dorsalis]
MGNVGCDWLKVSVHVVVAMVTERCPVCPGYPGAAVSLAHPGTMSVWEQGAPPKCDLKLDIRRRNVFVTQLEEGRDEEEENVTQFPIIKEAASKILETSKSTLQRTLVLKKEVEYDKISQELLAKRREFTERMAALDLRKEQFLQKQTECSDKASKFEKFLQDSEAKRQRAILKYQTDSRQNEFRDIEIGELAKKLEEERARQQKLHEKKAKNKIYEDFLLKTVDNVPENYLEYGVDSPVRAIIRRHETLSLTNKNLIDNLTALADEQELKQHELEALQRQHDTSKLMMNSELSQRQMEYDRMLERNKQLEMNFNLDKGQFRNQSVEVGSLLLAVTNLAELCHMKHYGPLVEVELLHKLDMIKEFILEKMQVEKLASQLSDEAPSIVNPDNVPIIQKKINNRQLLKNPPSAALRSNQANENNAKRRVSIFVGSGRSGADMSEHSYELVTDKYDIALFIEEHDKVPVYHRKLKDLQSRYSAVRRTRADGSCFYRALAFAYLEFLLGKPQVIHRFKDLVLQSKNELITAGFSEDLFRPHYDTFLSIVELAESDGSISSLTRVFNHTSWSDSAVQYLRLVTSAFIRNRSEFYQPFVREGIGIIDFCTQHVEPMATECDHIQISALGQALEISFQVEHLDEADTDINQHMFPEGCNPSIFMLYKQHHYTILYKDEGSGKEQLSVQ